MSMHISSGCPYWTFILRSMVRIILIYVYLKFVFIGFLSIDWVIIYEKDKGDNLNNPWTSNNGLKLST